MPNVPAEVVTNILSRLPVKPLLRFRCVSKPWCALIDNPHFINSHLNHSLQTNSNRTLLLTSNKLHSIDLDSLDEAVEINHPIDFNAFSIVGSCNGLLCLCLTTKDTIVLWNPSTHKCQTLPTTDFTYLTVMQAIHFAYGYGYDRLNDDYKVVRIVQFRAEAHVSCGYEVKVYSLKANSWGRIPDFPYYLPEVQNNGVLASGALHWIVHQKAGSKSNSDGLKSIAALELATEEYRLVSLPHYLKLNNNFHMKLEVLEGCLCLLCNFDSPPSVDIWVMTEYGVKESWTKLVSVTQPSDITFFEAVKPLVFSKSGEQVLWEFDNAMLVWNDVKRGTIENIKVRGLPNYFCSNVYVGSLVQLNGGDGSDVKKQQTQEKGKQEKKASNKRDDFLSKGFKLVL